MNDNFIHDGRGPELLKINHDSSGTDIVSIEYRSPSEKITKMISFENLQAYMVTPEEEYDYRSISALLSKDNRAILNMGKSDWYKSFTNRHSLNANHYKIIFYDQIIDVICNDVRFD